MDKLTNYTDRDWYFAETPTLIIAFEHEAERDAWVNKDKLRYNGVTGNNMVTIDLDKFFNFPTDDTAEIKGKVFVSFKPVEREEIPMDGTRILIQRPIIRYDLHTQVTKRIGEKWVEGWYDGKAKCWREWGGTYKSSSTDDDFEVLDWRQLPTPRTKHEPA